METIERETLTFKKSEFKITWKHFLLAIPPVAQFFLVWYGWQLIKISSVFVYKNFVKAIYTQTAIWLFSDASNLNKSVDTYHNNQISETNIKAKRFENVALLAVVLVGTCWFTLPVKSELNSPTVIIGKMIERIPSAAQETIHDHFGR